MPFDGEMNFFCHWSPHFLNRDEKRLATNRQRAQSRRQTDVNVVEARLKTLPHKASFDEKVGANRCKTLLTHPSSHPIGVTERDWTWLKTPTSFSHSNQLIIWMLQRRDCVIGKKANFWVYINMEWKAKMKPFFRVCCASNTTTAFKSSHWDLNAVVDANRLYR